MALAIAPEDAAICRVRSFRSNASCSSFASASFRRLRLAISFDRASASTLLTLSSAAATNLARSAFASAILALASLSTRRVRSSAVAMDLPSMDLAFSSARLSVSLARSRSFFASLVAFDEARFSLRTKDVSSLASARTSCSASATATRATPRRAGGVDRRARGRDARTTREKRARARIARGRNQP